MEAAPLSASLQVKTIIPMAVEWGSTSVHPLKTGVNCGAPTPGEMQLKQDWLGLVVLWSGL